MEVQFYTQSGKTGNFKRGDSVTFSVYPGTKNSRFGYAISQDGMVMYDGTGTVANTGVASATFRIPTFTNTGVVDFFYDDNGTSVFATFNVID